MNKKIFGILIILLVVVMPVLPISAVLAKKPESETDTLEGVYLILMWLSQHREFYAGESGHFQTKAHDLPVAWGLGDIVAGVIVPPTVGNPYDSEPGGYYHGNWVRYNAGTEDEVMSTVGITVLEDAYIEGIGTGNLKMFMKDGTIRIISGTGDFKGIKGTGTYEIDAIFPVVFHYSLEVQIP